MPEPKYFILSAVSLILGVVLCAYHKKSRKKVALYGAVLSGWLFLSNVFTILFGPSTEKLEVEIFPSNIEVAGYSVSQSVLMMSVLALVLLVLCLVFRLFVFPRFADEPKGFQLLMESAVEWVSGYSKTTSEVASDPLGGYIFSIGVAIIGCDFFEMLGMRSPASDLYMTGALAIVTFFLIQYYGIRKKGIVGRVKALASPNPIVFPFELIGLISTPLSLACRLFGNMLGGMIIIDLLYVALGNAGVGVPAVLGLYFNVFHPLIQAYIFITLSLTFIREAVE